MSADLLSVRAVILAGQRPGPDALCDYAGVTYKADIEIDGVSMLDRVADALRQAGVREPITLSGYAPVRDGFRQVEGGEGPADSALLAALSGPFPVLITTCDHALLTEAMVRDFIDGAESSRADMAVGLATKETIQADYPDTKRTYLNFSDASVSGCNLFYIRTEAGLGAIRFWREAQHLRKTPLKLAMKIGVGIALRYLTGRLSLRDAFDYAGARFGATAAPVLLGHAEAAIDVDKPADLDLVRGIIAKREGAGS